MITHLPTPQPVISPPASTPVPVGQPVFVSVPESEWVPIGGSISLDGITAEVRATPVSMRIISGDPAGGTTVCDGPGRPFDATDTAGPRRQAERPGTCVVQYRTVTGRLVDGPGSARLPERWIGTLSVVWHAEWRVGDGEWTSLGTIPRTRIVHRSVREVPTSIERR